MNLNKLRSKFFIMRVWAERYSIHDFPKSLNSLSMDNPTEKDIRKDYEIILPFTSHPAYNYFFAGYDGKFYVDHSMKE